MLKPMTSLFWEDFQDGDMFISPWGKTVGDADIKIYAAVTGDFQHLHMDDSYAGASDFEKRIAHGPLTASIALGLPSYFQVWRNVVSLLEWRNKLVGPVFIGDTLRSEMTVLKKCPTKKQDRGIVYFRNSCKNQRGQEVLQAEYTMMVRRRSSSAD